MSCHCGPVGLITAYGAGIPYWSAGSISGFSRLIQLPANMSENHNKIIRVLRPLPPTRETCTEPQDTGFDMVQPPPWTAIRGMNQQIKDLCVCVWLSSKYYFKKKIVKLVSLTVIFVFAMSSTFYQLIWQFRACAQAPEDGIKITFMIKITLHPEQKLYVAYIYHAELGVLLQRMRVIIFPGSKHCGRLCLQSCLPFSLPFYCSPFDHCRGGVRAKHSPRHQRHVINQINTASFSQPYIWVGETSIKRNWKSKRAERHGYCWLGII